MTARPDVQSDSVQKNQDFVYRRAEKKVIV
jgi:hypothetical protein